MQKVIPAILTADPKDLLRKLEILRGNTQWVQIDVTDSTAPLSILEGEELSLDLEIHLMVQDPASRFRACQTVRAKRVLFHAEHVPSFVKLFDEMQNYSFERGIALNPETQLAAVKQVRQQIDSVLCLSVHPGSQGQRFIPSVLEKVRALRVFSPDILIGMDGGINTANIVQVFEAGADYAVVGSALWKSRDPVNQLRKLEAMVQ